MKNKKHKSTTGFTIIELIVVVAIIAVLSTIVLSNLTQYSSKGKDAAIKEQAKQIIIAATDYFSSNGTYSTMCGTGTKCGQIESNISNLGGQYNPPNIKSDGSAYCMDFVLSDGASNWCVDSTGYSGSQNNCSSLHLSCQ
jgi:prepilin-type N-terminal cleavage/methylation domain-containing protein